MAATTTTTQIAAMIERHAVIGIGPCGLPRVTLVRVDDVAEATGELFFPVVCLVVAGVKDVQLGQRTYRFTPGTLVVSAVQTPIVGRIVQAPYRAVAVQLTSDLMTDLLMETGEHSQDAVAGFNVIDASEHVLSAMSGLLSLLNDSDMDRSMLGPGAERQLLYRVLQSPAASVIRQFALDEHTVGRVRPAVTWIRENVSAQLSIDHLAQACHLSQSSLFRHFREATGSTPLQFQKQLRLHQARRRLMTADETAAEIARDLGYANPAQFSREYTRVFGAPPKKDVDRRRG